MHPWPDKEQCLGDFIAVVELQEYLTNNFMAEISSSTASPSKGKVRVKRMSTRIDMTPMVDLAFLLLTFFILTTTLQKPYLIPLQMPDQTTVKNPPPVSARRVLTFILGEQNEIYWYTGLKDPKLNVTDYSPKGIRNTLIQKKREIKDLIVLVKPAEKSRYQNLINIIDEMEILKVQYHMVKITPIDKALVKDFKSKPVALNAP
jgi:biopolymer transport protein ExbD